jgi:hypothetical protein
MLFQRINRTDAEKVFVIAQNTSGASLAANLPVYWETDAVSDGVAVSQMIAGGNLLFAGINHSTLADDAYGLVQVYGARTSVVVCPLVSSYSIAPGSRLVGAAGAAYLAYGSMLSAGATTEATLIPAIDRFVVSMETIASAAGYSATGNCAAFIRAL